MRGGGDDPADRARDATSSAASVGAPAAVIAAARVTGKLDEGTLAEVFRAEQPELGRAVAIKILKGSIAPGSQLGKRFGREAVLLAGMAHQNLPQVYSTGEIAGRPYMVMELVEGVSLQALLQKGGPLTPDVATAVALRIARALEYLHLRGVVHRDLKPANVLVSRRGEVKLTDLGIAREMTEESDGLGVVGTPAYMSPEQVLGDRLDFRSDLFAFGIVLYEMLTGRRPFEEETARTVMQKIRLDRYTPPRQLRAGIPAALERILARCLEKNPEHRYRSTGALTSDLGEVLARAGVTSHEAQIVAHLARAGVLTAGEAKRALGPAAAWSREERGRDVMAFRWFLAGQGACALVAISAMGFAELARRRDPAAVAAITAGPRPPGATDVGYLRVVARPWAQVSIDGVLVDTTPVAQPFRLAPGAHFVRLAHPSLPAEARAVRIERGATVWLDVDLARGSDAR